MLKPFTVIFCKRHVSRTTALLATLGLVAGSLVMTNTAAAQSCPDVQVNDLSVTLPSNSCNYKLMDKDNGYAEVCNSWNNNSCGTLTNGNEYQVDKWTSLWAPAGEQTFTASGSSGSGGNPVDSLNTHAACIDPVVPGGSYDFSDWNEWRRCTPNGAIDTVVRSHFTGESTTGNTNDDWTGTGSLSQSADGKEFEIQWKNTNPSLANGGSHTEFDISIGRALYGAGSNLGYGSKSANDFRNQDPALMASAKFIQPVTSGKAHVQAIIWLNKNLNQDANSNTNGTSCSLNSGDLSTRESVDITVVEWLTQDLRTEYNTVRTSGSTDGTSLSSKTEYIQQITLSGTPYYVFKRDPGDFCELASYFLVRKWNQDYDSGYKYTSLKLVEVIDKVGTADSKSFLSDWKVSSAGWEIAGANQSQGASGTEAKLHYQCISLPSLNSTSPNTAGGSC